MTPSKRIGLQHAIASAYRLALVYFEISAVADVYQPPDDPEEDEHYLLEVIQGARDAWRPIWRRRSNRHLPEKP